LKLALNLPGHKYIKAHINFLMKVKNICVHCKTL
jgi:hypothetical protein